MKWKMGFLSDAGVIPFCTAYAELSGLFSPERCSRKHNRVSLILVVSTNLFAIGNMWAGGRDTPGLECTAAANTRQGSILGHGCRPYFWTWFYMHATVHTLDMR